jgi:agmatine deiminase
MHVDGEGTILLTDTVQLDPRPQPACRQGARVEAEMARTLGTEKAIWLKGA